jgi:hypothetical protein
VSVISPTDNGAHRLLRAVHHKWNLTNGGYIHITIYINIFITIYIVEETVYRFIFLIRVYENVYCMYKYVRVLIILAQKLLYM